MKGQNSIAVLEALEHMPLLDAHTHLVGGRLSARGLQDILLYHMVVTDLYAAGCPSGNRLTEYPGWPSDAEAEARILEALPFLQHVRGTSTFGIAREILRDLYDWDEEITPSNWRTLDAAIRERADDRAWGGEILDRAGIRRTVAEYARREGGVDDDRLQYSLEWAFFARNQWGEFDTALYELERCWGHQPSATLPIGAGTRPEPDRQVRTLDDVHAALDHYVKTIPYDRIVSVAIGMSTDLDYRVVGDAEMAAALTRREQATEVDRNIYAAYVNERFLDGLERKAGSVMVQFSLAAEPLPFESGSRLRPDTIRQLGEVFARHPGLRFQCFLAAGWANQGICTLARELPNLSVAGYWWHSFFPTQIRTLIAERLEMLPLNKQIGFFSDAYCAEWSYGKAKVVRRELAEVLGAKIDRGEYTLDDALYVADRILYQTPQDLLGMVPRS